MLLTSSLSPAPFVEDASLLARDQYERAVKSAPSLSVEEEEKLLVRVHRGLHERRQVSPNQWVLSLAAAAREELVVHYQPIIHSLARKFARRAHHMDMMDLVQEGNLALLNALERCEEYPDTPFKGLVIAFVTTALRQVLDVDDPLMHIPYKLRRGVSRLKRAEQTLLQALHRQPTLSELAAHLKVSEQHLRELIVCQQQGTVTSIQAFMHHHEIESEDIFDFAPLYEATSSAHQQQQDERKAKVLQAFHEVLTPHQQEVMGLRFGLHTDGTLMTRKHVGQHCGTGDTSTTEYRALARLRTVVEPTTQREPVIVSGPFYTASQVQAMAGVNHKTVYTWVEQGKLTRYLAPPSVTTAPRKGRGNLPQYVFDQYEVDDFLARRASSINQKERVA